jgi:hypothetical protein
MQTLEITTSPNVVCITVERSALNTAMLSRITDMLQELIPSKPTPQALTASELRRLPLHERDAILAAQTQAALHDFETIQGGEELIHSEEL